jgi:hypothetical protein
MNGIFQLPDSLKCRSLMQATRSLNNFSSHPSPPFLCNIN